MKKPDVEVVEISSIHEDPANVRKHPDKNIAGIAGCLAKYGQQKPIVVGRKDKVCIAGNGVLRAAKTLEWTQIMVIWSDLDGSDATGYAIADNRLTEISEWEYEALSGQLKALLETGADISFFGWTEDELQPLLAANWTPPVPGDLEEGEASVRGISLTAEQRVRFERALKKLTANEREYSDGEAVAVLSDFYIQEER